VAAAAGALAVAVAAFWAPGHMEAASAAEYTSPDEPTVNYSVPTTVQEGQKIELSGTGWVNRDKSRGSVIAVLLDDGGVTTTRDVVNPETGKVSTDKRLQAIVSANSDGTWSADIPYPTKDNSSADWAVGESHSVRLLTGSLLSGDMGRTLSANFTITAAGQDGGDNGSGEDTGNGDSGNGDSGTGGESGLSFKVDKVLGGVGQYMTAYSAKNKALWVTQAQFTGDTSQIHKVDPGTLETLERYSVHYDDAADTVQSVFGIDVDEDHNELWTTASLSNAVSVYSQADGSFVTDFPNVDHPRSIAVDESNDTAYASANSGKYIATFNTDKNTRGDNIAINGQPMDLYVDEANGKLYTVTVDTNKLVTVDLSDNSVSYTDLPGASRASGVAVSAAQHRAYVASQESGNLLVINTDDGSVVATVPTGNGALAVALDEEKGLAYVGNYAASTVSVVNLATNEVLTTIDDVAYPNDITVLDGTAVVVDRETYGGAAQDYLVRITPQGTVPSDGGDNGGDNGTGDPGDDGDGDNAGDTTGDVTLKATVPQTEDNSQPGDTTGDDNGDDNGSDSGNGADNSQGLSLTVDPDSTVSLAGKTLQYRYSFTGSLPKVSVTDNRSDDEAAGGGWELSAQATNFKSRSGEFSSGYLGWLPELLTSRDGVQAGTPVANVLDGGTGLTQAQTLASASGAGRKGVTEVGATLSLGVPKDTAAGNYRSTVTVSLFPVD